MNKNRGSKAAEQQEKPSKEEATGRRQLAKEEEIYGRVDWVVLSR